MYAIVNVSKKDLSKIIREFLKWSCKVYERRRPKHEPTDIYFHLAEKLARCMMRSDVLNSDNYPMITEMTGAKHNLILHVFSTEN